jgi:FtsP/CotA-like multicopper oxidase with cupredoxin domain
MRGLIAALLLCAAGAQAQRPVVAPLMDAVDQDPAPDIIRVTLRAERDPQTGRYFYNGQSPGPVIRGRVGDTLVVELTNALDSPTTIHWHGAEVPNAMDGAPWVQAPTPPGEQFEYRFELRHPGTFWYHPHFDTEQQVDAGLYGLLIVEAPAEPIVEELLLVFDADAEFNAEIDSLPPNDPGRPAHGHGGRAHLWRINGTQAPAVWTGRGGQTVRVRMVNVSNTGYVALRWPGLRQIASDQGLFSRLATPDQVLLSPGDRGEFEWQLGMDGFVVERLPYSINGGRTWEEPVPFLEVAVEAPAPPPAPIAWPFDGAQPTTDPGHADLIYTFHGSDRTGLWLINGEQMPDITIETIERGTRPIVEVRNISASHHPFHIHGMRFEVLSINGVSVPERRIEDTIDVGIRERIRVALHPNEPGEWMLHCHILPHADDGMMTVLRVQ